MTTAPGRDLDHANIELGKELFAVKCSLDIYTLIGLNAAQVKNGQKFLGHTQYLSLQHVALGLAKVFEREKSYELCSIMGIHDLAKRVDIQNVSAVRPFVGAYGVKPTGDWTRDIAVVLVKQRPAFKRHLRLVSRARDTRIAHLQRAVLPHDLPSIAAFEELLTFGVAFHTFINAAFLNTSAHPILTDHKVADSLGRLLTKSGLENVVREFPD